MNMRNYLNIFTFKFYIIYSAPINLTNDHFLWSIKVSYDSATVLAVGMVLLLFFRVHSRHQRSPMFSRLVPQKEVLS